MLASFVPVAFSRVLPTNPKTVPATLLPPDAFAATAACDASAADAVVIDADPTEKIVITDNAPARILVLMVFFFMMIAP